MLLLCTVLAAAGGAVSANNGALGAEKMPNIPLWSPNGTVAMPAVGLGEVPPCGCGYCGWLLLLLPSQDLFFSSFWV